MSDHDPASPAAANGTAATNGSAASFGILPSPSAQQHHHPPPALLAALSLNTASPSPSPPRTPMHSHGPNGTGGGASATASPLSSPGIAIAAPSAAASPVRSPAAVASGVGSSALATPGGSGGLKFLSPLSVIPEVSLSRGGIVLGSPEPVDTQLLLSELMAQEMSLLQARAVQQEQAREAALLRASASAAAGGVAAESTAAMAASASASVSPPKPAIEMTSSHTHTLHAPASALPPITPPRGPLAATHSSPALRPGGGSNAGTVGSAPSQPGTPSARSSRMGLARGSLSPDPSTVGSAGASAGGVLFGVNSSAGRVAQVSNPGILSLMRGSLFGMSLGARQPSAPAPSAPTTPAVSPLRRTLTAAAASASITSRSAHTSPHHAHLNLPHSASAQRRRPSVSLLASADELPEAREALARAHSTGATANRGSVSQTAAALDAAAPPLFPGVGGGAASGMGGVSFVPSNSSSPFISLSSFSRPDAMISYSRKDLPFVRLLVQHFENAGRNVWVDFRNIPKAVDFMESIKQGIRESNAFVYIISPDSVASKYCDAELEYALQYGKRIIPLVIREVHADKVRQEIQSINWIFCCTRIQPGTAGTPGGGNVSTRGSVSAPQIVPPSVHLHEVFPHLLDSVLIDPLYVLMHTKLLVRAMEWEENMEDPSFLATGRELEEANRWMAKSRMYERNQKRHQERVRRAHALAKAAANNGVAPVGVGVGLNSNAASLASAPMPTRIQKLFLFASNERVAETHKKEQLLMKFFEQPEEDEHEHGAHGHGDEGDGDDDHGGTLDHLGLSGGRVRGSNASKHSTTNGGDDATMDDGDEHDDAPSLMEQGRSSHAATTRGSNASSTGHVERGSLGRTSSTAGVKHRASMSISITGSMRHIGAGPAIAKKSSSSLKSHTAKHSSLNRLLPHLAGRHSRYAAFHASGGLRNLLATQAELMSGFMSVIAARDRAAQAQLERDRWEAAEKLRFAESAAAAAALNAPGGGSESSLHLTSPNTATDTLGGGGGGGPVPPTPRMPDPPPPLEPLDPSWKAKWARARFALFEMHESVWFLLLARILLFIEAAVVFTLLVLVLSGYSGPLGEDDRSIPEATTAIRPLRIILLVSLACFLLEMILFVIPIHWGLRRLRGQKMYLSSLALLLAIVGLEAASWGCEGLLHPSSAASIHFTSPRCQGNMFLWLLILRSWHVILRGIQIELVHPLVHSLHALHVQRANQSALVTKMKTMLRILHGEIAGKEEVARKKWEKLKSFHPSRRFSKVGGDIALPPGAGAGGGGGGGLAPAAAAAQQAAAAAAAGGGGARGLVSPGAANRLRGVGAFGSATLPRAGGGGSGTNRSSTILPGAYGGGVGGSLLGSMQASRTGSILMQSPTGNRQQQLSRYQNATMPVLKSPVTPEGAAAAAAIMNGYAGASSTAAADGSVIAMQPFDSSAAPSGAPSPAGGAIGQHSVAHMGASGSATPFALCTPPRRAVNASEADRSAAPSPSPMLTSIAPGAQSRIGAHTAEDSGAEPSISMRADSALVATAAAALLPRSGGVAAATSSPHAGDSSVHASPSNSALLQQRKAHRKAARRVSAAGSSIGGSVAMRFHPDPNEQPATGAVGNAGHTRGVESTMSLSGIGLPSGLSSDSQQMDGSLLMDLLADSDNGGLRSARSGFSGGSSGLSGPEPSASGEYSTMSSGLHLRQMSLDTPGGLPLASAPSTARGEAPAGGGLLRLDTHTSDGDAQPISSTVPISARPSPQHSEAAEVVDEDDEDEEEEDEDEDDEEEQIEDDEDFVEPQLHEDEEDEVEGDEDDEEDDEEEENRETDGEETPAKELSPAADMQGARAGPGAITLYPLPSAEALRMQAAPAVSALAPPSSTAAGASEQQLPSPPTMMPAVAMAAAPVVAPSADAAASSGVPAAGGHLRHHSRHGSGSFPANLQLIVSSPTQSPPPAADRDAAVSNGDTAAQPQSQSTNDSAAAAASTASSSPAVPGSTLTPGGIKLTSPPSAFTPRDIPSPPTDALAPAKPPER